MMVGYSFVDVSDDVMDMVVDAEFEMPFPSLKAQAVLRELSDALEVGVTLPIFFQGLSTFQIAEQWIKVSFRFSRNPKDLASLGEDVRDELARMRVHFILHVLARIDRVQKLGSVPFPADSREFIEFSK